MRRIYLVEDDAIVAMGLRDTLEELGYAVCGHAQHASEALVEIPALLPDLVLMDVNLGPGLSGIDVAERIAEQVDVPVVFVTAYSDAELTDRAPRTGSYAYIVKPFHPNELRANVQMALLRHDTEKRLAAARQALDESAQERIVYTLALERAHVVLESAFATTPDAVLVVDAGGRVEWVSPRFAALWGVPEARLASRSASRILAWCAGRVVEGSAFLADETWHVEGDPGVHHFTLDDGRVLERRVEPQRVEGVFIGTVLRFREIDQSLDRPVSTLLEQAGIGVARVSASTGRIVAADARFAESLGLAGALLVGRDLRSLLPEVDRPRVSEGLARPASARTHPHLHILSDPVAVLTLLGEDPVLALIQRL